MKHLDEKTIRKLAQDSMFTLTDEEVAFIHEDSKVFLAQIKALHNVDASGVEAMNWPFEQETQWLRSDDESNSLPQEAVFKNAPLVEGDFIEIVKVLK